MNGSPPPADRAQLLAGMDRDIGAVASLVWNNQITWDTLIALHASAPLPAGKGWARKQQEERLALALRNHLTEQFGQEATFSSVVLDTLINHLFDRGPLIVLAELRAVSEPSKIPA
ncbi:MAG: hypothetical protein WC802_01075 [Patescibacteria group bacterium]|jgi:hypothetical protein